MDKKIPDLLRKWIATVDTLPARLIQQLEAERRKAGSRKEKKRGRPAKHPLEELRDAMVDLAVTEQVFKRPPRAASRTIAELSGRGAFKGKSKGALRARHNKQLREMKEQKLEEPIRKAIRDHGKTLYIKRGNLAVRADKVAAASARIKDLEKKVEALSPAEKTQLGRVYWLETPALLNLNRRLNSANIAGHPSGGSVSSNLRFFMFGKLDWSCGGGTWAKMKFGCKFSSSRLSFWPPSSVLLQSPLVGSARPCRVSLARRCQCAGLLRSGGCSRPN